MRGQYKMPKKYSKSRKYNGKCEECGKVTKEVYQKVDGNNIAISYHALYLCEECYKRRYSDG